MTSLLFRMFLVAGESLNFTLLYLYALSGLGAKGFVNPWTFLTMASSVAAVNLAMGRGNFRYLAIVLANLSVFLAALLFGRGQAGLFSLPGDLQGLMGFWATWTLLAAGGGRAAFLAWTKNPPRYGLFDINMVTFFLVLLLASSFNIHLPGVQRLLFLAILSNVLMLFFGSREEIPGHGHSRSLPSLAALAALLVPMWVIGHSDALSLLEKPAGSVVEFSKPFFDLLLQALTAVLLAIFRLMKLVPRQQVPAGPEGGFAIAEEGLMPAGESGPFIRYLLWCMAVFIAVLALLGILYLLWLLLSFLFQKRSGRAGGGGWSRVTFRDFLAGLFRAMKRLALLIAVFLPLPIGAGQAYRSLLLWGKSKGSPRRPDETAYEYLDRLIERYPGRERELSRITGSFVRHRYSREGRVFEGGLKWYVLKLYLGRFPLPKGS